MMEIFLRMRLNGFKAWVFKVIQPDSTGNAVSKAFDIGISFLVMLSVICVFAVTFELSPFWLARCRNFEAFASVVFTVEYLLRLWTADLLYPGEPRWRATLRYMRSGMAIVDLLAVLPFYLPMFFSGNLLAIRIFRLLRLLRIFKLNRYFESLSAIGLVIKSRSRELIGSMFFVLLMLVMSSLIIYAAEHEAQPEAFKNAFSGLWWAVATLTTVGYGDIYPVTVVGRIFGAVIAVLGIGMVAIPTGIISSGLVERLQNEKEGKAEAPSDGGHGTVCPHCGRPIRVSAEIAPD